MQVRKHSLRFVLFFLFLIVLLFIFCVKLVLIQIFNAEHLASLANKQYHHFIELEPIRGSVYDRKLRPLAFNVSVPSVFANPRSMTEADKTKAVTHLSTILNMDPQQISSKLSKEKYFVWIQRKIAPELKKQIEDLKLKGIDFRKESKRFYPNKNLAAHIVGFAGVDNKGLEGLELVYNKELSGQSGRMQIIRDARQRELLMQKIYVAPQDGHHVVLTIDETIQYITERALRNAIIKNKAKAGTVIVMDVKTGEILSLANYPTYNLDDVKNSSIESRTNRAISFMYEPGSVFKMVTAAAALEEDMFVEEDKIDCENGKYRVANNILHDTHPYGLLSFREVFEKSSNIGVTKIAQKIGGDNVYKYASRFRFGKLTGINLRGEVGGILKPTSSWSKTTIGAVPIGHEVTATPLQLVSALAALANDGVFMKPHVVKEIKDTHEEIIHSFEPQIVDRVVSVDTARRVRLILEGVVENGTGKRARIKGVRVAGKTGTAQKVIDGQYSHKYFYATFFGFAPVEDPRLAAIVVFDEPRPYYYGGTVSAPVFKEVIENSLKYLDSSQ